MKPRILPEDIKGLSFVDYRKLFIKELKRMKSDCSEPGSSTNFMMMTEWEFPDFPGKDLPLIVIGDFKGTWEKFYKSEAKKRSHKDFSIGNCSFGNQTQAGEEFILEVRGGKIKSKGERALDKVILSKVGLCIKVVEKGGADNEEDEGEITEVTKNAAVTSVITATNNNVQKPKKEVPKNKEERISAIKEQSKNFKRNIDNLKNKISEIKKQISPRLKLETLNRKDLLLVQSLKYAFSEFFELFENADPELQKKFAPAKKELDEQNEDFAKVALIVKAKKKSLAQQLADKHFSKNGGRTATEEEVSLMQHNLRTAIAYRQLKLKGGEEKMLNLKAIYKTAELRGPAFRNQDIDKVFERIAKK